MDKYPPPIAEYRKFSKEKATETLERLIKDGRLVQWIEGEVGYDPTPREYKEKANWETTKLKEPEDSTKHAIRRDRGWQGTMPSTRHEAYVLDRILDRTQGYSRNVDRSEKFEDTPTTLMIDWMGRDYPRTEYWNDKAKAIFNNNAGTCANIDAASEKSLAELTILIKQEIMSQELKAETVQLWDFFYTKLFDKNFDTPKITDKINWEEVADYFLVSASISTGENIVYYKKKYC